MAEWAMECLLMDGGWMDGFTAEASFLKN